MLFVLNCLLSIFVEIYLYFKISIFIGPKGIYVKHNRLIPKAPIARLIFKAGAARVSDSAAVALTEILEDMALDIGAHAVQISKHAGRKTVNKGDVELAKSTHK